MNKKLAEFIFELSTLRKTARSHRQTLLTGDLSDNIASHSFVVSTIGIFLAEIENADIGKVLAMCVSHDWKETRSGDQNWLHKNYVSVDDQQIEKDQFLLHRSQYMKNIIREYEERKTLESKIAKDADTLDQLILLKEYTWVGNKEASVWLTGRSSPTPYAWTKRLLLKSSIELGKVIYDSNPSDWWNTIL